MSQSVNISSLFVGICFVSSLDDQPFLLFSYPPIVQQEQKVQVQRVFFPKNVKKAKTYAKDNEEQKLFGIPVASKIDHFSHFHHIHDDFCYYYYHNCSYYHYHSYFLFYFIGTLLVQLLELV